MLFVVINLMALLGYSVHLALQCDQLLTYAATRCGADKEEVVKAAARLESNQALAVMGPVERARLVCLLSQRAHS